MSGLAKQHFESGLRFFNEGKYRESIREYREVLKFNPRSAETQQNLAHALMHRGRNAEALAELQAALRTNPHLPSLHHDSGLALLKLHRYDESLAAFRQALRQNPEDPDFAWTYFNMGLAYFAKKDAGTAREMFQKALSLDQTLALPHMYLGHLCFQNYRFDEAIIEYQTASRLDPTIRKARKMMALSYVGKMQFLRGLREWVGL